MTSLPYPTFIHQKPIDEAQQRSALPAVGRCRIYPATVIAKSTSYREIVIKNLEQATVKEGSAADEQKKLKKKYMKEGVAMAKKYLMETLSLDVSVIDVECVVDPDDLISTDGCLAACLLDAGCQYIVTDGTNLAAMDAAKIPRERVMAHFQYNKMKESSKADDVLANLVAAFEAASGLASVVSVELSDQTDVTSDTILAIFKTCSGVQGLECVIQIAPSLDEKALEFLMKEIDATKAPKGRISLVDPTPRQLGLSYAACIRTDRDDNLYTTVVCTRNGEALGLVYSSKVCYFSYSKFDHLIDCGFSQTHCCVL